MAKQIAPAEFLATELAAGINPANPKFVKLANLTAQQLKGFEGMKVIDYGAGVGVYAKAMQDIGFEVAAHDIWKEHRDFMRVTYPGLKIIANPIKADLMLFIEVAEHMTDEEIEAAIDVIKPVVILFSSTPEKTANDEAWGHINVKSEEDWLEFWAFAGYELHSEVKKPTAWSLILRKI